MSAGLDSRLAIKLRRALDFLPVHLLVLIVPLALVDIVLQSAPRFLMPTRGIARGTVQLTGALAVAAGMIAAYRYLIHHIERRAADELGRRNAAASLALGFAGGAGLFGFVYGILSLLGSVGFQGFAGFSGIGAAFAAAASASGPPILTGGEFGPEASIVAMLVCMLASTSLAWFVLRRDRCLRRCVATPRLT